MFHVKQWTVAANGYDPKKYALLCGNIIGICSVPVHYQLRARLFAGGWDYKCCTYVGTVKTCCSTVELSPIVGG